MTDPIADMLTRIRNAQMVNKIQVEIPHSKFKETIAYKLKEQGYVGDVNVVDSEPLKQLVIKLKYYQSRPVIESLIRVSKPSLRNYVSKNTIPRVKNGLGVALISTSQGLFTDREAREKGLGGEVICEIY